MTGKFRGISGQGEKRRNRALGCAQPSPGQTSPQAWRTRHVLDIYPLTGKKSLTDSPFSA
jgi:hypothetical protein